jgi:4-hydroxy-2-oxoglutarate aldolase
MKTKKAVHRERLSGVFAPITTSFDDGTNREFRSLSTPESMDLLKKVVKTAFPDKVVMAGTGAESTSASRALASGCGGGRSLWKPGHPLLFRQKSVRYDLIDLSVQVVEKPSIPVLLYNNSGVTGITMSTTVIKEASSHSEILGMRDSSSGNLNAYILKA